MKKWPNFIKWLNVFLWQAHLKMAKCFEIGHEIASLAILFLSLRPANFSSNRNVALHARSLGPSWARHLETSTMFYGFGNIIKNDFIEAIGTAIRYDMKEISAAPFVAAEVDKSTDVTNKDQISVIMWLKAR